MKQEVAPHFESPLPYMLAFAHDAYPCTGMFCIVDTHPHLSVCLRLQGIQSKGQFEPANILA